MKVSVKKDIHTGNQPIRVLKHNITHRLANRNENLIKNLQSDFRLDENIRYNIAELPLSENQMPFIDSKGVIHIHESYLSYIWIISFTIFVLYEEGVVIPDQIKKNIQPSKQQNLELIKLTEELFAYSKSLVKIYTDWDKDYFPNPEFYDRFSEEGWYIERTNDLYVETINFVLFHEIAHAELEHIKTIKTNNLTYDEIKKLELEADTRAINLMLENNRNEKATELSIIIGLASMLFCQRDFDGGLKHPNIDMRISNAIQIIEPNEDSPLWPFLALFLKLWDKQFTHNFIHNHVYDTFKDLYYELLAQAK